MKYNMMIVTFWFNELENVKEYQSTLDEEFKDCFSPFNLVGVPANMDPIIPRITANTLDGYTTFNMSKINVQIITNFDGEFTTNIEKCFNYVKEKAEKVFDVLVSKCNLNVLYSAIHVNTEYEDSNPIEKIAKSFFNSQFNKRKLSDIGVRFSEKVNDKYYHIATINDAKVVSFTKKIEQGVKNQNIIFPLISEKEVIVDKNVLAFNIEINDKYSFNTNSNYSSNKDNFNDMFEICLKKIAELSKNVLNNKII